MCLSYYMYKVIKYKQMLDLGLFMSLFCSALILTFNSNYSISEEKNYIHKQLHNIADTLSAIEQKFLLIPDYRET